MNKEQNWPAQPQVERDMEVLSCRSLVKEYRQGPELINVLRGVELTLMAGERLAIIGSSGSGKSTLLNLMGGLDAPDKGEVRLLGDAFSTCDDNRRGTLRNQNLGFVYQFHHLLGEFTALENTAMPQLIAGVKKKEALAEAKFWLERVGLSSRVEHKPSELSGGERQRVAIARALVNRPACVLMDEPTGNLDRQTAQSIQSLLAELSEESATSFVIVTHDEQLADSMDRILLLEGGQLLDREKSTNALL